MAELKDEEFEKLIDDKLECFDWNEEVYGVVQCTHCEFWGECEGIIEASDPRFIKFVCSKCTGLIRVKNPDHIQ